MNENLPSDWLEDDLFEIDTHSLFRPDDECFSSHAFTNTFHSGTDFSPEPLHSAFPDPELAIFDSGYISSNSSDSGKHSPSGSESNSDQGSPWIFPPPGCQSIPQNFYQKTPEEQRNSGNVSCQAYTPITPRPSPSSYTNQTVSPPPPVSVPSTQKYVYLVPSSTTARVASLPVVTVPAATPSYSHSNPTIYVESKPPTVYVKAETASTPIYISQTTGAQLQPIAVTAFPAQKFIVARETAQDSETKKIEDRKAKNRAAAQASRAKKRNEVDDLKATVDHLKMENDRLLSENLSLRQRLSRYERPCEERGPTRKRIAVAGTMMMAVFMVMAVNPISFPSGNSTLKVVPASRPIKSHPLGRVLDTEIVSPSFPTNSSANCLNRKFYNSTEAIKLNNDLYEWVDRHEAMGLGLKGKRRMLQKKQNDWLSAVGNVRVNVTEVADKNSTKQREKQPQSAKGERVWRHLDMISSAGTSGRERRERVRKFLKADKNGQSNYNKKTYEKLTAAIQQKEDTLYVVALEDYFLLPALERNFTSTPKVTLILPALSYNSTVSGKVPLMRIDLRVVGTGLFQLSQQLLPLFLQ